MEKKSLLEFLDEVSKERGFDRFSHATDIGKRYAVEEIIKEAGKRYVKQYLEIAAENAVIFMPSHHVHGTKNVDKQSITNIEIDV